MKYTEGICQDGAAILKDGLPIKISEILSSLNEYDDLKYEEEQKILLLSKTELIEFLEMKKDKFSRPRSYHREWQILQDCIDNIKKMVLF